MKSSTPQNGRKSSIKPQYQYEPLDPEANEIRLLTLLPGDFGAEVRISLEKVELTADNAPEYEALSYAWGSTKNQVSITVRMENMLLVTQSLAAALPYLRHEIQPRVFWIDAICVNQQDIPERSRQVERMRDIFSLAERVVVWLGPAAHDCKLALSTLETLSLDVKYDRRTLQPRPGRDPSWADLTIHLEYEDTVLRAISSLLGRSWFSRLWIRQELHLAKPNAVLQCGCDTLLWTEFCNAIGCFFIKAYRSSLNHSETAEMNTRVRSVLNLVQASTMKTRYLNDLIRLSRGSSCTDPRDQVFALLGMATRKEVESIKADYSKGVDQVYKETCIALLEYDPINLNLLSLCDIENRLPKCETWVPNLHLAPKTALFYPHFASGSKVIPKIDIVLDGVLRVVGKKVGLVKQCFGLIPANDSKQVVKLIRNKIFTSSFEMGSSYFGGGSVIDACCCLIRCNLFAELIDIDFICPSLKSTREALIKIILVPDTQFESDLVLYDENLISRCVGGRKVVLTDDGYLALASEGTQVGDEVCILLGCRQAMILRPTKSGQYEVVGESYVQGMMDGEALLGPLGINWRIKRRFDNKGFVREGFVNMETGVITKEDPRLGPLPDRWETPSHDNDEFQSLYLDTKTGKQTWNDPRMTIDALRKRGVDLQTFDLI